jgi:hypothetical protein
MNDVKDKIIFACKLINMNLNKEEFLYIYESLIQCTENMNNIFNDFIINYPIHKNKKVYYSIIEMTNISNCHINFENFSNTNDFTVASISKNLIKILK